MWFAAKKTRPRTGEDRDMLPIGRTSGFAKRSRSSLVSSLTKENRQRILTQSLKAHHSEVINQSRKFEGNNCIKIQFIFDYVFSLGKIGN